MPITQSLKKAALVLQNLPPAQATKVMERLPVADLHQVFQALDQLDGKSTREVFQALDELARDVERLTPAKDSTATTTPATIVSPDQKSQISESYRESPFGFLITATSELVHRVLQDEHPKSIATVLAHLPPELAADQLKRFEPIQRVSIVKRLCETSAKITAEERELAYMLKQRLQKLQSKQTMAKSSGVHLAAQVLALADSQTRETLLAELGQRDPVLEQNLNRESFRFEDLGSAPDADIKRLLANTDTSFWAPALKHATRDVRDKILANMAPKAARLLSQEIKALTSVPPSLTQLAQSHILGAFFNLRRNVMIVTSGLSHAS